MKTEHARWKRSSLFLATLMTSLIFVSSTAIVNVQARTESDQPYIYIRSIGGFGSSQPDQLGNEVKLAVLSETFTLRVILHGPTNVTSWSLTVVYFIPSLDVKGMRCDPIMIMADGSEQPLPPPPYFVVTCEEAGKANGRSIGQFTCATVLLEPKPLARAEELVLCEVDVEVFQGSTDTVLVHDNPSLGTLGSGPPLIRGPDADGICDPLVPDPDGADCDPLTDPIDAATGRALFVSVVGPVRAAFSKGSNPKAEFKHMDISKVGNVQTITAFVDKLEQKRACVMIRYIGTSTAGQSYVIDTDFHRLNDFTTQAKLEVSFQHDPVPSGWKVKASLFSSEPTTDPFGTEVCLSPSPAVLLDQKALNYRVVP